MDLRPIPDNQKKAYNNLVGHVVQSWEWGQFRTNFGIVKRFGLYRDNKLARVFQITFHKIPFLPFSVGFLPKGPVLDEEMAEALRAIGQQHHCVYIKAEPYLVVDTKTPVASSFRPSPKPYFTKHNFVLDLDQSDADIQKHMHPKFRYNIQVAQKHGVVVEERTDEQGFQDYLKLYFETTRRQGFHGHNERYHRLVWETLKKAKIVHLLIAYYRPSAADHQLPLTAWMLFSFGNTLYYPYGGSSNEYRNVMPNNLVAWEAIKLGKRLGLKQFDLWGATKPDAPGNDPFLGFTRFKSQIGATPVEYQGSFDLVLIPWLYYPFVFVDRFIKLKVFLLRLFRK